MKKALLMITLCATLAACSSEEPATDGKQPSGQTETQEVKKELLFKYFGLNKSSIVTVWKPTSGDGSVLDLYFESPRFEVVEAQKQGNFLKMKLKLNAVNETSVQGVELPLTVHLLQP